MGKGSEGVATSSDSETNGLGSCEAHHLSSRSEEDCGISTGKMGENQASEKGCVALCQLSEYKSQS